MKLFISQPMRGKTDEEILNERENLIAKAKAHYGDVEVINSFFGTDNPSHALEYLGESIKLLSEADVAIFAPGWENARGCRIEHSVCEEYKISINYLTGKN